MFNPKYTLNPKHNDIAFDYVLSDLFLTEQSH